MNENQDYKNFAKSVNEKVKKFETYTEPTKPSAFERFKVSNWLSPVLHFAMGFYVALNIPQLKANWEVVALAVILALYIHKLWK